MKKITLIIAFVYCNIALSQQNYVLVEYVLDNYGFVNNETLLANQQNSKHVNDTFIDKKNEDEAIQKTDDNSYLLTQNSKLLKIETFQTIGSPFIYQLQHNDKQQKVFIKDSLPDFNWKIESNTTKVILGFDCVKATCRFRGTDIVAFFAEKIPVPFGPWKFGKLPGLILEIHTENTPIYYHWQATKIKYPYESKVDLKPSKDFFENITTMREYIQQQTLNTAEKNKILDARTSNGVRIISSKSVRGGIEKKYEWEE
jgi:GLPGLI family protein